MEKRTFLSPDVQFDSEIEFCVPSWTRHRKYVSWKHWFTTKFLVGRHADKEQRTACYKLFEMGHYAGAVILEIGLRHPSRSELAIQAAVNADWPVQYYAVETNTSSIVDNHAKFKNKRLDDKAVHFRGTLAEFRNFLPVTPTMVVINDKDDTEGLLSHLALFLASGTPVLVHNWFKNRADLRQFPGSNSFEVCGRFSESILLRCVGGGAEHALAFSSEDFELARQRFSVDADGQLIQNRGFYSSAHNRRQRSDKKWPFKSDATPYPATLPDGSAWPKISIVTPSFNQGEFIEETIASVLNQRYPNLEYIVVDAESTDQTPEVLDRYSKQIDHIVREPDNGQSDAINKGMSLATGELLMWLNSDDMLPPGTLFASAMAFWKNSCDMVAGAVQLIDHGEVASEHLTSCESGPLQLGELLDLDKNWLAGRFFYQPEVMYTRDLWERAGGFVNADLYYSMDYELWLRFAIAGANLHVIGRPTAMFRVHDQQKTTGDYEPELRTVNRRFQEKYGFPNANENEPKPKDYKVTFVNDSGARYGAGIAHGRLRDAIAAAGHQTQFVAAKVADEDQPKTETQLFEEVEASQPDLVVVGNLHNAAMGMSLVDQLADTWPTCMVMHDLWLATGRCLYHGDCEKFKSSCDATCPSAMEYPALQPEQIQTAFETKLNVINRPRNLVVAANSKWTQKSAEQSAITGKGAIQVLKLGFPIDVFKPRDMSVCRELLGLPHDAFLVLFSSVNVSENRKGVRHLFEALNRLQLENLVPVCMGHMRGAADLYPGTISLGYIDDPHQAALAYAAADIFVGPSLEEAFGQVFIEAAACGTPSVGYPVGGVVEAIQDGVTGKIAKETTPAALADAILHLYSDDQYRKQLSVWGRIAIENEWSYRSSYHRFNNVLRNVANQFGFQPPAKIDFDPTKTDGITRGRRRRLGILEKTQTQLQTGTGFANEERLQLSDGTVCRARWAVGLACHLNICVDSNGPLSVWAECLNPVQFQRMTVYCNDVVENSIDLQAKQDFLNPETICLLPELGPGEYQVRVEFSNTVREQDGSRELSMLFANLRMEEKKQLKIRSQRAA